jgi:thioredoxin
MEELTEAEFDGPRLRRPGTVVVCFWATWCGFCHRFLPKFNARDGKGPVPLARADISDEENPLWERFQIEVVPALIAFRDGAIAWRIDSPLGVGLDDEALTTMDARLRSP